MGFLNVLRALGRPAARVAGRIFRGGADDAARAVMRSGDDVARAAARRAGGGRVFVAGPRGTTARRAPLALPAAGQTTTGTARGSQLGAQASRRASRSVARAEKSAQRAVSRTTPNITAAADEAADAARKSITQRLGAGLKATKKYGLPIAAAEGVGRAVFNVSPIGMVWNALGGGQTEPEETLDVVQAIGTLPQAEQESLAERFQSFIEQNPYAAPAAPDLLGQFQADAARQRQSLEDYLASTGEYSRNQAQAIADAYQGMSQNLLESSGDIFQRGQVTAADIDRLYETLAAENLGTAYGEGLSTPVSDTAGLAAPSGEMATGAETARAYGGSLADYLGQEAGIESAALEQVAGSQALQGAALAQSLRDYVTMAEAEKRYQLGRELSAQEREVAAQQALLQYEADLAALDYQRQLAQQMFGFEATDAERAQVEELAARDAANIAASLWATATGEQRKIYERMVGGLTGQAGLNAFVQMVYNNPGIITALGA